MSRGRDFGGVHNQVRLRVFIGVQDKQSNRKRGVIRNWDHAGSGKTTMAVAENDSDLRLASVDAECDVKQAIAVEVRNDGVTNGTDARGGHGNRRRKTTVAVTEHELESLASG